MARMINCEASALTDSVHDSTLYRIIKHNNHVRVPGKNPIDLSDYVKDTPTSEWEILDRDGVNLHFNEDYVEKAKVTPEKRLAHPNDVFLFESSPIDNPASHPYGTLAMAGASISAKYLTRSWDRRISIEEPCSWKDILQKFHIGKTPPSNALVIIDRYLFDYQPAGGADYRNGIRNVYGILNELLPLSFQGEYHILIVFDPSHISRGASLTDIAKDLQTVKKKVRSGSYIPTIELLPVSANSDHEMYHETHDRKILSNYYLIEANHGFSALLPPPGRKEDILYLGQGRPAWNQKLAFKGIYAGIDKDEEDLDLGSLPIIFNNESIQYLRKYYQKKKENPDSAEYICNGNSHSSIAELRNRLIVSE